MLTAEDNAGGRVWAIDFWCRSAIVLWYNMAAPCCVGLAFVCSTAYRLRMRTSLPPSVAASTPQPDTDQQRGGRVMGTLEDIFDKGLTFTFIDT
jgi:hypothetical protein